MFGNEDSLSLPYKGFQFFGTINACLECLLPWLVVGVAL